MYLYYELLFFWYIFIKINQIIKNVIINISALGIIIVFMTVVRDIFMLDTHDITHTYHAISRTPPVRMHSLHCYIIIIIVM